MLAEADGPDTLIQLHQLPLHAPVLLILGACRDVQQALELRGIARCQRDRLVLPVTPVRLGC